MTRPHIRLSAPTVGPGEARAVAEAITQGWTAPEGPLLERFERELAAHCGRERAVAVASGTAAVHLQLLAAGIGPGDVVACPTVTFVAGLNMIAQTGARAVLIDCDEHGSMSPQLLQRAMEEAAGRGAPITAVLPVDLYGRPADHGRLGHLAAQHGAHLLVDAAQSLGSIRRENGTTRPAASEGRAAAISFNSNKIITASGGGAVLTDDHVLADRVAYLAAQARTPADHDVFLEHGFNYRLSHLLAALGLAQLQRLEEFISARRAHRARYRALTAVVPGLSILGDDAPQDHNCWLTVLLVADEAGQEGAARTRRRISRALAVAGVETRRLFTPLHTLPVGASPGAHHSIDGTAEDLFARSIVVPSAPSSSPAQIDEVCLRIHDVLTASRPAPVVLA